MHSISLKSFFLLLILLASRGVLNAQIKTYPIGSGDSHKNESRARITAGDPLRLPFWDDFSDSSFRPDTSRWVDSENVFIAEGIGNFPPSLNVAVFDGANVNGQTYSQNSVTVGKADVMTSKEIDISDVSPLFINSIHMSFYWQLEGRGDIPDPEDSIRLQFLDVDEEWQTVWSMNGGIENKIDTFVQEIIHLNSDLYAHEKFQFRFESFSRLAGAFDTWLIDYILIDKIRDDTNDIHHSDKTITSSLSSLFGEYSAIPSSQFFSSEFDPSTYLMPAQAGFKNLSDIQQAMQYSATVRDTISNQNIQVLNDLTDDQQPPGPLERRLYTTQSLDLSNINEAEKVVLETTFSIKTNDKFLIDEIVGNDTTFSTLYNLAANDTVRNYFTIDDYFAYDDGSAEFGAGINITGGQIAYEYELAEEDTLTAFDIYFPNIGANFSGTNITLMVWKNLDGEENSILSQTNSFIKTAIGPDRLQRYELSSPVILSGTFYIGYIQTVDNRVTIGLDKNTNSGDNIFFNVSGNWEPNEDVEGSLMMRPVFENGAIITSVTPPVNLEKERLSVYPNPSHGKFSIKGRFEHIELFDTQGRKVPINIQMLNGELSEVTTLEKADGLYILRAFAEGQYYQVRLILKNP